MWLYVTQPLVHYSICIVHRVTVQNTKQCALSKFKVYRIICSYTMYHNAFPYITMATVSFFRSFAIIKIHAMQEDTCFLAPKRHTIDKQNIVSFSLVAGKTVVF